MITAIKWTEQDLADLGKMTDQSLANRMTLAQKVTVSSYQVRTKRLELNIDAFMHRPEKPRPWTPEEVALLGTIPDKEVAQKVGRPVEAVAQARVYRKIAVCRSSIWTEQDLHDLGKVKDSVIAQRKNIGRQTVAAKRKELQIPPAPPDPDDPTNNRRPFTEDQVALFGTMPDHEIAEKLNRPYSHVKSTRIKLGIAPFTFPNRRGYVVAAQSELPLSWTELSEVDQHAFYRLLADAFFERTGRELTFNLLSRLSLWPVRQLKLWFVPQSTKTGLPVTTRHHLWLAVLMGL